MRAFFDPATMKPLVNNPAFAAAHTDPERNQDRG